MYQKSTQNPFFFSLRFFIDFGRHFGRLVQAFLFIFAMGWARYHKNCHNIFQIIAGTIFGGLIAKFIFHFITPFSMSDFEL